MSSVAYIAIIIILIIVVLITFGSLYWMGYIGKCKNIPNTPVPCSPVPCTAVPCTTVPCPPITTNYEPCKSFRSNIGFKLLPPLPWTDHERNIAIAIIGQESGMNPTDAAKLSGLHNTFLYHILFGKE